MIIKGAEVFQEDGTFCRQEVRVKGGKIVGGGCEGVEEEVIDASGLYAVPGLIDIHFHGCMGKDLATVQKRRSIPSRPMSFPRGSPASARLP